MKKLNHSTSSSILLVALALMAFTFGKGADIFSGMSSSGAPAGYSGDPANGNKNCTNCHSGSDAQSQAGWITSDIPETGYVPGTTYTITSTAEGEGISKFGFQISPQNSEGIILGTLVNTNDETKLVSGTKYVTHTSAGNSGSDSKTWSFDWTAPEAGSGEVVFYGAFNLANNNGGSSGDDIILSTLAISESSSTGLHSLDRDKPFSVYPNPARDYLTIETAEGLSGSRFIIYDQSGRRVCIGVLSSNTTTISIEHLNTGIYYILVGDSNQQSTRFIKK